MVIGNIYRFILTVSTVGCVVCSSDRSSEIELETSYKKSNTNGFLAEPISILERATIKHKYEGSSDSSVSSEKIEDRSEGSTFEGLRAYYENDISSERSSESRKSSSSEEKDLKFLAKIKNNLHTKHLFHSCYNDFQKNNIIKEALQDNGGTTNSDVEDINFIMLKEAMRDLDSLRKKQKEKRLEYERYKSEIMKKDEGQSLFSSSGHESFDEEKEINSKMARNLSLDNGISLKNTTFEVCNHQCPACCTSSNSFSYDKETGKFVVYLDEDVLRDFDDNVSLKDLDMSKGHNVFMSNLCLSFLIDLMNRKNVFLKKFIGECRNLEKALNLSLFDKTKKIFLTSYIEKIFEQQKEIIPSKYRLNDIKFRYTHIKECIQEEEDLYDCLKDMKCLMFRNYINQFMSINIVTRVVHIDDSLSLKSEQNDVLSKFINYTRRCYLDLLNYVFRSILEENKRINNEIYQKELEELYPVN